MPNPSITVSAEMAAAGEKVLLQACERAEIPTAFSVLTAARDVYIAMETTKRARERFSRKSPGRCHG